MHAVKLQEHHETRPAVFLLQRKQAKKEKKNTLLFKYLPRLFEYYCRGGQACHSVSNCSLLTQIWTRAALLSRCLSLMSSFWFPITLCPQTSTSAASTTADVTTCVGTRWAASSAAARRATSCWPTRGPAKVGASLFSIAGTAQRSRAHNGPHRADMVIFTLFYSRRQRPPSNSKPRPPWLVCLLCSMAGDGKSSSCSALRKRPGSLCKKTKKRSGKSKSTD